VLALPPAGYHYDERAMQARLWRADDATCERIHAEHWGAADRYLDSLTDYAKHAFTSKYLTEGFNGATRALSHDMASRWLRARWKRRYAAELSRAKKRLKRGRAA
jgi:hypothetical protein